MRARRIFRALAALAFAVSPSLAHAADKLVNTPAEKFVTAPGGVDMRTGRYVYSETDLSIGPEQGGLTLTRILTANAPGHLNPFANLSHNWDVMVSETPSPVTNAQGNNDLQVNVHYQGRSQTYQAPYNGTVPQVSSGLAAPLTYTGDRSENTLVYTWVAPDGTKVLFRPLTHDCSASTRCAYVERITQPDGTRFTFDYAAFGISGAVRLSRVISSRGYALLLEGSDSLVTRACVVNLAQMAASTCPAGVPTTTYGYAVTDKTRLVSVTGADSKVSSFTYAAVANGGTPMTAMGFVKPGQSTPWLVNTSYERVDELQILQDVVHHQAFAGGQTYSYSFTESPYVEGRPSTLAGGMYTDATGAETRVEYDWPVAPGANHPGSYCQWPNCRLPSVDDAYTTFVYQQTPGPVAIVDPLDHTTRFDFCDAAAMAGLPSTEQNRCVVLSAAREVTDPEGIRTELKYDSNLNVIEAKRFPKPGVLNPDGTVPAPIVTSATYVTTPGSKSANKPLTMTDARSQTTTWTYSDVHGGVTTETGPEVDGVAPQKRYGYIQRTASLADPTAASPVWLLDHISTCRTTRPATVGPGCSVATDEVVTSFDYGPGTGPNNLLPIGQSVSADNETMRTCYAYDGLGRKISETSPGALLAACPATAPTGPLPYTTSTRYDVDGRVTGTIAPDPDGAGPLPHPAVRKRYDDSGRLIQVEQGSLSAWQPDSVAPASWTGFTQDRRVDTEYDALDRKTREWTSTGDTPLNVTEYSYDLAGRLKCTAVRMNPAAWSTPLADKCVPGPVHAVHGADRISKNVYDAAGRLTESWEGVGTPLARREALYTYNWNDQKLSLTDARSFRAEMRYDGFGRQSRWLFPSKTAQNVADATDYEEYGYDPNGNRTSLRKRDGKVIYFGYDALNRVWLKNMPAPYDSVRYAYDLRGLQTVAWFTGAGSSVVNSWDGFGRMVSTTTNMGGASRTVSHKYDYDGRDIQLTFPDGEKVWTARDGLGRSKEMYQGALGSTATIMTAASYYPSGQLYYFARRFGDNSAFTYDGGGRLTMRTDGFAGGVGDTRSDYLYNPAGQLASEARTNDD
ncbi:MAG TPA: hypothetical protein VEW26_01935, partial [Allosphingosinicella sp.]|nr:hypothetical protein [Allosphingosinicella sp.]